MPKKKKEAIEEKVEINPNVEESNLDNLSLQENPEANNNLEVQENSEVQKDFEKLESPERIEMNNQKIDEATEEVKGSKTKRKKIIKFLLFFVNIGVVIGILFWNLKSSKDFTSILEININYEYLAIIVLLLVIYIFLDVFPVSYLIRKVAKRPRWALSYKSVAMLRYYDAVTPLSTGGQPFMIVYLISRDIPATTAVSIPISKLIFQQICWLLLSGTCLVISLVTKSASSFVGVASIIGFSLAAIVCLATLFLSLSKKSHKVMNWGLKVLHKMKIIKNFDKAQTKLTNFVNNYQNIMVDYANSKLDTFVMFFTHMARYIILYSIPFFIYCTLIGFNSAVYTELFMYSVLIELAASFIPLPGGTGMNEISFTFIFSTYFGGATFWALLLWRTICYYYNLIQGILVIIYDTLYGNRKYKWVQKSRDLQYESQIFKQQEIDKFRSDRNKRRKRNAK